MTLAAILIVFSNWRLPEEGNLIKNTFYKNNLQARLEQEVNEKVKIIWQPVWEKGSYEELKTSVTYACIPLRPEMRDQLNNYVDGKFELPNTSRYLVAEKQGDIVNFSIRTFIGENHDNITSGAGLKNFTGTVLIKSMDGGANKLQRYNNGPVSMLNSDPVCVYWTVCTWHGAGAVFCAPYVTTTSMRSSIPYAYPCTYPGNQNCTYFPAGSHVEQYCE